VPQGNCTTSKTASPRHYGGGTKSVDNFMTNELPQRTMRHPKNLFFLEQFQIALPREWKAIILRRGCHRPGGCQSLPKSELPP
jgi:hypothetical protein